MQDAPIAKFSFFRLKFKLAYYYIAFTLATTP